MKRMGDDQRHPKAAKKAKTGGVMIKDTLEENMQEDTDELLWVNPNLSFHAGIPFYSKKGGFGDKLQLLEKWASETESDTENKAMVLISESGTGKTTLIREVAKRQDIVFARQKCNCGIFKSIDTRIGEYLQGLPEEYDVRKLEEGLENLFFLAFGKIFENITHRLNVQPEKKNYLDFIDDNGLPESIQENHKMYAQNSYNELKKVLSERNTNFLWNIDEIQNFRSPVGFFRKERGCKVDRKEYEHYRLVALSLALEELKDDPINHNLRIILSGTNIYQDAIIRIGSDFKSDSIDLPFFTVEIVEDICNQFLHLSSVPQTLKQRLFTSLEQNGRALEKFLSELRSRTTTNSKCSEFTSTLLDPALDSAYQTWVADIENPLRWLIHQDKDSNTNVNISTFMVKLLVALQFPEYYNGKNNGDYVMIPQDSFPTSWKGYASSGAFRIRLSRTSVMLYRPRGFVKRYMEDVISECPKDTVNQAMCEIITEKRVKMGGHGHLFELFLAIELTLPLSHLYVAIIDKLTTGTKTLLPDPEVFSQPVIFQPAIGTVPDFGSHVFCASDDPAVKNRKVDVGFPLLDGTGKRVKVYIEAKTENSTTQLWRYCATFFSDTSILPGPRIFISWIPFQHAVPKTKKTNTGLSAYQSYEKVTELIRNNPHEYCIIDGPKVFNNCHLNFQKLFSDEATPNDVNQLLSVFSIVSTNKVKEVVEPEEVVKPKKLVFVEAAQKKYFLRLDENTFTDLKLKTETKFKKQVVRDFSFQGALVEDSVDVENLPDDVTIQVRFEQNEEFSD